MEITGELFFGGIFFIFALAMLIQGIVLKWEAKTGHSSTFFDAQTQAKLDIFDDKVKNRMGNISFAVSGVFLLKILFIYLFPYNVWEVLQGGAAAIGIVMLIGVVRLFAE